MSIFCIINIIKFDPSNNTFKKSLLITFINYSVSPALDFALFLIIVSNFIPPGDYGTGLDLIVGFINLLIFIPLYIILGNKTYKKFKDSYPDRTDLRACKSLWEAAIIKAIFAIFATVWIFEVA
jgi:hypothetical protein